MRSLRLADEKEREDLGGKAALAVRPMPRQRCGQMRGKRQDGSVPRIPARYRLWCWNVRPRIVNDGVIHRFVEVDGHVRAPWLVHAGRYRRGRRDDWLAMVSSGEQDRISCAAAVADAARSAGM